MVGNKKAPVGASLTLLLHKLLGFPDQPIQELFAGFRVQKLIPNILVNWQG